MEQLISDIKNNARANHIPVMEEAPAELLKEIISSRKPKKILEIGTAVGYSGLIMLSLSPDAFLTTIEINTERLIEARKNFEKAGVIDRVRCIEDDANFVLSVMEGEYDFILLDGPKSHYRTMFEHLLRLLSSDGMIFIDDILYQGFIEGEDYPKHKHRTIITNMRALIKEATDNSRLKVEIIKKGDGVMLICNKEE